eukprot:scaffold6285_cov121-Isochrysis_galbana.AAC.27
MQRRGRAELYVCALCTTSLQAAVVRDPLTWQHTLALIGYAVYAGLPISTFPPPGSGSLAGLSGRADVGEPASTTARPNTAADRCVCSPSYRTDQRPDTGCRASFFGNQLR